MVTITFNSLQEINDAASKFIATVGKHKHFAFYGQMGAGKTTFIKEICKLLEVTDMVTSPTFAIINEYHTKHSYKVFHFDFYRIKNIEEVFNLGYEDYFYADHYCFVEWPELIEDLLPEHMIKVNISASEEGNRTLSIALP